MFVLEMQRRIYLNYTKLNDTNEKNNSNIRIDLLIIFQI